MRYASSSHSRIDCVDGLLTSRTTSPLFQSVRDVRRETEGDKTQDVRNVDASLRHPSRKDVDTPAGEAESAVLDPLGREKGVVVIIRTTFWQSEVVMVRYVVCL